MTRAKRAPVSAEAPAVYDKEPGTPSWRRGTPLTDQPPQGEDWIYEVKHDGYRTLLVVERGQARAYTRNGFDLERQLFWDRQCCRQPKLPVRHSRRRGHRAG